MDIHLSGKAEEVISQETIVVDTDVCSYGFRGDSRFAFYHGEMQGKIATISFMTLAESDGSGVWYAGGASSDSSSSSSSWNSGS